VGKRTSSSDDNDQNFRYVFNPFRNFSSSPPQSTLDHFHSDKYSSRNRADDYSQLVSVLEVGEEEDEFLGDGRRGTVDLGEECVESKY